MEASELMDTLDAVTKFRLSFIKKARHNPEKKGKKKRAVRLRLRAI